MGFIEARIGITNLGENYRSLGFFPPLPRTIIDMIHADEDEHILGLPYIRLKDLKTPDKVTYTETTTFCGNLNPSAAARDIGSKIIEIAAQHSAEVDGGKINRLEFRSSGRDKYLFGFFSQVMRPELVLAPAVELHQDIPPVQLAA